MSCAVFPERYQFQPLLNQGQELENDHTQVVELFPDKPQDADLSTQVKYLCINIYFFLILDSKMTVIFQRVIVAFSLEQGVRFNRSILGLP